jgi:pimeloyl-ACP methyl ester carboxylesterase
MRATLSIAVSILALAAPPSAARAEDRVIATPSGEQVEYRIEGSGPAILMIPSLGRGAADFDDLSRRLVAAGLTAIRPQPRGIGKSSGAMTHLTLHDLAADAAAVIEALGGKPVIVIGHAYGQRVGRTLAADHPALVRAMIMVAAGGKAAMRPGAQQALLGSFRLDQPPEKRMQDVRSAFFAPGHDASVWQDGWYPDVAKAQLAATQATPVEGWWNAGSTIPLLVIQGLQDTVAPPENGHMMKDEMGDRVELIDIDGAGHAMLPEQPEAIAAAIIRFAHAHR